MVLIDQTTEIESLYCENDKWFMLPHRSLRVDAGKVMFRQGNLSPFCAEDGHHLLFDPDTGLYLCPACPTAAMYLVLDEA